MGPKINPIINNKLSVLFCFETRAAFKMPLTPASLPFPIKNIITAKPIITPPRKADCGVKFEIFIKIWLVSLDISNMIKLCPYKLSYV